MAHTPEFQFYRATDQFVYKSVFSHCHSNENQFEMILILSLTINQLVKAESIKAKYIKHHNNFENLENFGENFELFVECTKILSEKMDTQSAENICTDVHQKSPTTVRKNLMKSWINIQVAA